MTGRRRVLIVDGYNVIRNNARYASDQPDFEGGSARNEPRDLLVSDVALYASGDFERATVVFDGSGNPSSTGEPTRTLGVDVVFSPAGVSADSVIEKLAYRARAQGLEVVVVSSDFAVQSTVFGGGVTRMSAAAFAQYSNRLEADCRSTSRSPAYAKTTLAERIPAEAAEQLRRLRDGC